MLKLSIITINYNNLSGLRRTVDSVMSQTWRGFEWILIDGGSNDGSKEYIESIAAIPEANVSYWCSEPDNGVYNAMNKGIAIAKGNYLNFMNSGDIFFGFETLEKWNNMKFYGDIIYGDWIRRYRDHDESVKPITDGLSALIYFVNICHQAMFIKKEKIIEGYDEKYRIFSDWRKWQELACAGVSFQYIPLKICIFEAESGLSEKGRFVTSVNEQLAILDDLPQELREHILRVRHLGQFPKYDVLERIFQLIDHRPIIEKFFSVISVPLEILVRIKKKLK